MPPLKLFELNKFMKQFGLGDAVAQSVSEGGQFIYKWNTLRMSPNAKSREELRRVMYFHLRLRYSYISQVDIKPSRGRLDYDKVWVYIDPNKV